MSKRASRSLIAAGLARVIFGVVAVQQWAYVHAHPYAYGPAQAIAWGAGAGALLAVAVLLVVLDLGGDD